VGRGTFLDPPIKRSSTITSTVSSVRSRSLVSQRMTSMAMTPEAKVKKEVVKQLKALDAYYFFPATGGYGKSGVPDVVGCYNGNFFGIECKAGKNTPTALQEMNLKEIANSGGISLVINEKNVKYVSQILTGRYAHPDQVGNKPIEEQI
jgi:hypothetical protein